jgi:hypothetical protein
MVVMTMMTIRIKDDIITINNNNIYLKKYFIPKLKEQFVRFID